MKVRLPTKLRVLNVFQYNGVNVLYALDTEGEEVTVPSSLKCTRGHGNLCTHSKPFSVTELITWDDNRWWRSDMPNVLNGIVEGLEGSMPVPGSTRTGHRGVRVLRRYDYRDPWDHVVVGTTSINWYCTSHPTPAGGYYWFRVTETSDYAVTYDVKLSATGIMSGLEERHRMQITYETGWPTDPSWTEAPVYGSPRSVSSRGYGWATGHYQDDLPSATYYFWFNELNVVWNGAPKTAFQEKLMSAAFTKAFEQVPQYADNNIANMLEIGGACLDLFRANPEALDKWGSLVKKYAKQTTQAIASSRKLRGKLLRDAWMTYRYAYCTTSSDVKQAIDTAARRAVTYLKPLRFDGNATLPNPLEDGGEVTCHVQFDIVINAKDVLRDLHHYLQLYGVSPSLYKAWDLVPFSFVADWFFDIGGVLKRWEQEDSILDYRFSNFWWSMKYNSRKGDRALYKCYSRWSEYFIPEHLVSDYNSKSSARTWFKRIADGYCLVHK